MDPQRALSYQRALATFTRIVSEADSELRLLQNAAAQVARITHIQHVKVLRYRPDQGDLLIEAGAGWKVGVVGHVSLGADRHSAPGRSLQTGAPVACEDIRNDPEFRYADVLREHGIISVLNVSIFIDGSHCGVLEVDTIEKTIFEDAASNLEWTGARVGSAGTSGGSNSAAGTGVGAASGGVEGATNKGCNAQQHAAGRC